MLTGIHQADDSGILPSVTAAQTVMEPVNSAAGKKQYVVQAGAFAFKGNARKRLREVRKLGGAFKKVFMVKTGENYVVQTGVFDVEGNARRMAAELEKAGICTYIRER